MRGARSTLILLIVAVGLGAYVYLVELERPPASETPPPEQLFELDAAEITDLEITAGDAQTAIRKDSADEWQLSAPVEARADEGQVSSMTRRLSSIDVRRVLEEGPVDLEPFGLAEPVVEVSFSVSDGTAHRLLIGNTTPTGVDRYAKLGESDRVVLIPASLESDFNKSTFDLRDKSILEFDTTDIDHLEIASDDATLRFEKGENAWRVVEPWDVRADYSTVEALVGRLGSGQMRSVVTEDASTVTEDSDATDSGGFGLEEPALTATLGAGSATVSLVIGDEAPEGTRYARDATRSLVFTVDTSLATDLERDVTEYRQKNLFGFRPFNATRLEIAQAETTTVFEKVETEDADTGTTATTWRRVEPSTADIERPDMDDLLAKLSNLRAESFVASRDETGLDDTNVVATVVVTFDDTASESADTEEERVIFWRTGEDTYAVHGDEPGAALVNTRSVDEAFETFETAQSQES